MPELPEVEVVRRGLEAHVLHRTIDRVEVLAPRPLRRHLAGPEDFAARLIGRLATAARRRGKYLWLALDSGDALLGHLGMSGQLLVQPVDAPAEPHLRVRLGLGQVELRFVDQRMFGGLSVSTGGAVLPAEIRHIARDLLDPQLDRDLVVRRMRGSRSAVKRLLLHQGVVSGVGNIYADEGLWRAGIHGDRPGERLPARRLHELLDSVGAVMGEALRQGGTSFDSLYVNVNGESGYFDRSLAVYGQEGRPCPRCGTPVRRIAFMNRSSYFCPHCQHPPRATSRPLSAVTRS